MLEKARQQPQRNTTIDILDNAVAWKIRILSLSKFLVWLEKVSRKRSSEPGVRELRGHYLKLETGTGRPDFRQLKSWPKLCFSEDEPSAFPPPKPLSRHDPQRMTRKVGKTGKDGSTAPGGGNGYCEICRIHYDQLDTHVTSSQHVKLVSDPVQYSQLDSLISQHELGSVTSLRKSLRIAKSPPVEMGTKHSMDVGPQNTMNGHVTRSKSEKVLCNGLSPDEKKKEKRDSKSGGSCELTRVGKSDSNKEKEKERDREKEKERERERERERAKEREREKEKERERALQRDKEREERAKEREREREKERAREKEREREERAKEREREREKERAKEKEREKEERAKEREREREERAKERDREREEREREREERAKEREREREERAKEREREKGRERGRERRRQDSTSTSTPREGERSRGSLREVASSEEPSEADHNLRSRHTSKPATPQAKRARPVKKRLSVEEKLIEDNRSYYKVEVLNAKLRSTGMYQAQHKAEEARVNGEPEENGCAVKEEVKEPVVVRFRKVRKTQLAVLSDEAENFMFGDLTRREAKAAYSESSDDSRAESDSSDDDPVPRKRKKKRKGHSSEGSERRSSSPKNKYMLSQSCAEEDKSDDEPLMSLSDISFSFENPPQNEPWMDNYVPERKPYYFPHYHEYPIHILPYEYPPAERMKLLSAKRSLGLRRRGERFSRLLEDGKPRKSPRCHASTLAIMSSLMRRRPTRECTTNPDFTYEEESRSSLPETVDTSSSASDARLGLLPDQGPPLPVEPSGDAYAIALARLACGETTSFQVAPGPCLPVDLAILTDPPPGIECPPGLTTSLAKLADQSPYPLHRLLLDHDLRFREIDSGSDCSDLLGFGEDGRGVSGRRRKRKRNLTGWPLGKPRRPRIVPKEEEPPAGGKSQPCEINEIKLEPISQVPVDEFAFKEESGFGEESISLPVIPIKRGRGRPRKYPLLLPPSSFSSPPPSPKSSPKKKVGPRFTFSPRRSCLK